MKLLQSRVLLYFTARYPNCFYENCVVKNSGIGKLSVNAIQRNSPLKDM